MTRLATWVFVVTALCLSAEAAVSPGSISGFVKDSKGVVQMGAAVEVIGVVTGQHQLAYTDDKGYFSLNGLLPGSYDLRVSAPLFLTAVREDVPLGAGAAKVITITQNTIFEASKMLPDRKRPDEEDDSWKWTLRSSANRPILRYDDGVPVVVEAADQEKSFRGGLAFMAGGSNDGYGSGADLGTSFLLEQSVFTNSVLALNANLGSLGYGNGVPDGVVRASFRGSSEQGGIAPEIALTVRRFAPVDTVVRHPMEAMGLSFSRGFSIGDMVDFRLGGEMQAIQFMGRANAFRPYGSVDFHLTPDTVIEYGYATSEPTTRNSKGFDSAPADFTEAAPHISLFNGDPLIENAHHHEISVSQRVGLNKFQLAYFRDRIGDTSLLGVGDIESDTGYFLPDVYSGTFNFTGGDLESQGVRFVYQRKITDEIIGTFDYSYGGALNLAQPGIDWNLVPNSLEHVWRHSAAIKFNGNIRRTKTNWIASYRYVSGQSLTPVDAFNASAGQTDPFFNLFVRQQIPRSHLIPVRMEALVDLRNLLAQGYVPIVGPDGKTVYLVQSARSVRGGLAFTF